MLDKKHTGIIYIPEYVNLRTSGWQSWKCDCNFEGD